MAIRLRTVEHNGERIRVALCAVESDEMPGDVYLDDGDHRALAVKFSRDWIGHPPVEYPSEWAAMDTQKLRDAAEEFAKWDAERNGTNGTLAPQFFLRYALILSFALLLGAGAMANESPAGYYSRGAWL